MLTAVSYPSPRNPKPNPFWTSSAPLIFIRFFRRFRGFSGSSPAVRPWGKETGLHSNSKGYPPVPRLVELLAMLSSTRYQYFRRDWWCTFSSAGVPTTDSSHLKLKTALAQGFHTCSVSAGFLH